MQLTAGCVACSHFTGFIRAVWTCVFRCEMSQDNTMDPTENLMSTQELLANDLNRVSLPSQTSEMEWDNNDVFSEQITLCQEYIDYHKTLTDYYTTLQEKLKTKGIEEAKTFFKEEQEPKKPSKNLKQVINDCFKVGSKAKSKKLNQLEGLELLEQLKRYVCDQTTSQTDILPTYDDKEENIDKIKSKLVQCNNLLKRKHHELLKIVVVYGQWLIKLKKHNFGRFSSICREVLNITPSWCRKMCKISSLFGRFPKLQQLSLTISEALQLVKKIDLALQSSPTEQTFWKQSC